MGGRIMASTINSSTSNGIVITPDTSGEIELQANGVTKAKITANGLQDANGNSITGGMYRNLIINGDMSIAQRGTSASMSTNAGYYTCDRWLYTPLASPTGVFTQTQDTDVPTGQGFSNSLKMQCTTAQATMTTTQQVRLEYRIEGQNLQHLKYGTSNAEKLTLSFWVKTNKTGSYIIWLYQDDDSRMVCNVMTISTADTWEKITWTIDGDTTGVIDNDNGIGLRFLLQLCAGPDRTSGTLPTTWVAYAGADQNAGQTVNFADSTSNYINITGVQLEVGSGSSDFEFLPYDVQLARCQRYFVANFQGLWSFTAYSSTDAVGSLTCPVPMRTNSQSLGYTTGSIKHTALLELL